MNYVTSDEDKGIPFQGIEEGYNQKLVMKEDETTLSHKGIRETHKQLIHEITVGKFQEPITTENKIKLACVDNQNKEGEEHSNQILDKYDEELLLLENLLRGCA